MSGSNGMSLSKTLSHARTPSDEGAITDEELNSVHGGMQIPPPWSAQSRWIDEYKQSRLGLSIAQGDTIDNTEGLPGVGPF